MSKLIVEVSEVESIEKHPNADSLQVLVVKGWQVCTRCELKVGDLVVFFPPDCILPSELALRLGVAPYLKESTHYKGGRVAAIRLRGEPSYGFISPLADFPELQGKVLGDDVASDLGITKYEPPVRSSMSGGDSAPADPVFLKYTSIENIGNYPNVFVEGEPCVIEEKIHGASARVGLVLKPNDEGIPEKVYVGGSHNVQRKEFDISGNRCPYWISMTDNMKKLLEHVWETYDVKCSVSVYSELYGKSVQDMEYSKTGHDYIAYDISIDGKFIHYHDRVALLDKFEIKQTKPLYIGPFSREKVKELTSGPTTLCEPEKAGKFKGREGVVIRSEREGTHPKIGRKILKSISVDYLSRKNALDLGE